MTNPLLLDPLASRATLGPSGCFMNLILDSPFFLAAAISERRRLRFVPAAPLSALHFLRRPTVAAMYSYGRRSVSSNREAKTSAEKHTVRPDTVLEALTACALHWNVSPRTCLLKEVEALVDFESQLDNNARQKIWAIVHNEICILILQRL